MRLLLAGLLVVVLAFFLVKWQMPRPAQAPAVTPPPATSSTATAAPVSQESQSQPEQPPSPSAINQPLPAVETPRSAGSLYRTFRLFEEPVEPKVFELASGALAVWRDFAAGKPALVVFSTHPFLDQLPAGERKAVRNFVHTAAAAEIVRRGRVNVADPAFIPPQTVSAAIDAGLIGELVFVQPTTREIDKFSLPEFQQRAFAAGFLTEKEALALRLKDGVISGKVRGLPFRCVHPEALPEITRPVIVHVDLGYFKDLFVNEVKTPLYNLLYGTARDIRDASWLVVAATLSYSNQEAEFSLDTRFMISNLATIMLHPELLQGGTPPSWKLRGDATYTSAMFDESAAQELTAQAVEVAPDDPDALYALFLQKLVQRQPDEAFTLLDRAVAHDPGYALAYLEFAEISVGKGEVKRAEDLLRKAVAVFPLNPFIRISFADFLIRYQRGAEAIPLLQELQKLPWSPTVHYGIPGLLEEMLAAAEKGTPPQ